MVKHLIFLLLVTLIACQNEETFIIDQEPIDGSYCGIEVFAYSCATLSCETRIPFIQKTISLYETYEDARVDANRISQMVTTETGKAAFTAVPCGKVYIRIDTEEYGCYISSDLLNESAKSHHDARFVTGFIYDKDDRGTINQRAVSLDNPTVGQISNYRHHVTHSYIDFLVPSYTENMLTVAIIDQLDDSSYLIEETIDSLYSFLFWGHYPQQKQVRNIWSFQDDSLHVLPYKSEYFGSFVWNISTLGEGESSGWAFPLIRPDDNLIDMNSNTVNDIYSWSSGHASDYELLGTTYTDLITESVNYTGWDGPLKFRVYNKKYGPIRSLNFFGGMSSTTQGFDLVLE